MNAVPKPYLPVRADMLRLAVEALKAQAESRSMEAHMNEHSDFTAEDTEEWRTALHIENLLQQLPGRLMYREGFLAPVVLDTLIHVHHLAEPLHRSRAVQASLDCLAAAGLIQQSTHSPSGWNTTAKGDKHIEALCALHFPKE